MESSFLSFTQPEQVEIFRSILEQTGEKEKCGINVENEVKFCPVCGTAFENGYEQSDSCRGIFYGYG